MAENRYYGIYQGIVSNIKDPEKRGRIKVKCPKVLGGSVESAWCDPVVPIAYDNGGDFCIPLVDEAVWLLFLEGDANRPVYIGGWWSKNKTPMGDNYTKLEDLRIISYADCIITMNSGKITINVGSGKGDLYIEDHKITIEGDLVVNGNISATSITATNTIKGNSVKTNTIDLATHKHGGVTTGSDDSDVAK